MKDFRDFICDVAMCVGVALVVSGGGISLSNWSLPSWNVLAPHADAATYVYEKDTHMVPPQVEAALNTLNRERKVLATIFEQDTLDGNGQTPTQYKVPLAAAKEAGLPALVVTGGAKVLKVVKAPTTEQQVLEAVP